MSLSPTKLQWLSAESSSLAWVPLGSYAALG